MKGEEGWGSTVCLRGATLWESTIRLQNVMSIESTALKKVEVLRSSGSLCHCLRKSEWGNAKEVNS